MGVYGCAPDDVFMAADELELEPRLDSGPNELRDAEDDEPADDAAVGYS
jgi:hypothetical protein